MADQFQYPHSSPVGPEEPEEGFEGSGVKASKEEVNFRPAGSSETNCGSCGHYLGDGLCEVVSGTVSTEGVSDLWEPRAEGLADLVTGG